MELLLSVRLVRLVKPLNGAKLLIGLELRSRNCKWLNPAKGVGSMIELLGRKTLKREVRFWKNARLLIELPSK